MVIKELSAALVDDWFEFFDERAFADHAEWKGCYCTAFYSPRPEEYASPGAKRRDYARWLIESGRMKGYVAYEDAKIVGWVNANDRTLFPRLGTMPPEEEKILSVVCFIVQKEHRRRGIAQALLGRITEDAKERGYSVVEAYPKKKASTEYGAWNGPYGLYLKLGFEEHRAEKTRVLRLRLA